MGLLSRFLKTPDDDADDLPDEFQAEESGLLMATSPPSEEAAFPLPEAGVDPPSEATAQVPLEAGGEATPEPAAEIPPEAEGAAPTAEGGAESPSQEMQGEPPPSQPSEDSSDDPLAAFRSAAGPRDVVQAIQQDLEEVPVGELLAEARSIRDALTASSQGGLPLKEAEEEAA